MVLTWSRTSIAITELGKPFDDDIRDTLRDSRDAPHTTTSIRGNEHP